MFGSPDHHEGPPPSAPNTSPEALKRAARQGGPISNPDAPPPRPGDPIFAGGLLADTPTEPVKKKKGQLG